MAKYMVFYNSPIPSSEIMRQSTPEQMQTSMQEWIQWKDEAVKTVKFEFGMPLEPSSRITPQGTVINDSQVSGYSIMEGEKEEIIRVLQSHPHLKRQGATIDVLEMLSMPGM